MIRKSTFFEKVRKLPKMWIGQWKLNKGLPLSIKLWWAWKSTIIVLKG